MKRNKKKEEQEKEKKQRNKQKKICQEEEAMQSKWVLRRVVKEHGGSASDLQAGTSSGFSSGSLGVCDSQMSAGVEPVKAP